MAACRRTTSTSRARVDFSATATRDSSPCRRVVTVDPASSPAAVACSPAATTSASPLRAGGRGTGRLVTPGMPANLELRTGGLGLLTHSGVTMGWLLRLVTGAHWWYGAPTVLEFLVINFSACLVLLSSSKFLLISASYLLF